jgi:hypothetical protein
VAEDSGAVRLCHLGKVKEDKRALEYHPLIKNDEEKVSDSFFSLNIGLSDSDLQNMAEKWFSQCYMQLEFYHNMKFNGSEPSFSKISSEEVKTHLTENRKFGDYLLRLFESLKLEKKPKNSLIQEKKELDTNCAENLQNTQGTSEVSEQTEVSLEGVGHSILELGEKAPSQPAKGQDTKTIQYRRLAPNEPHPCDGELEGRGCSHEAKYVVGDENYYCENHFQASRADCERNGYVLTETMAAYGEAP